MSAGKVDERLFIEEDRVCMYVWVGGGRWVWKNFGGIEDGKGFSNGGSMDFLPEVTISL